MADSTDPIDLVLSYVINLDGTTAGSAAVHEALRKGYRVYDVLVVPAASQERLFVTVTVVLSQMVPEDKQTYKIWFK